MTQEERQEIYLSAFNAVSEEIQECLREQGRLDGEREAIRYRLAQLLVNIQNFCRLQNIPVPEDILDLEILGGCRDKNKKGKTH